MEANGNVMNNIPTLRRPGAEMSDLEAIGRCIAGVARAKDGRGRWHNQAALQARLLPGTTPTIARLTAEAARRVGEAIAQAAQP